MGEIGTKKDGVRRLLIKLNDIIIASFSFNSV
jgi:hypothetical protein